MTQSGSRSECKVTCGSLCNVLEPLCVCVNKSFVMMMIGCVVNVVASSNDRRSGDG